MRKVTEDGESTPITRLAYTFTTVRVLQLKVLRGSGNGFTCKVRARWLVSTFMPHGLLVRARSLDSTLLPHGLLGYRAWRGLTLTESTLRLVTTWR